ncbi:hypothetical protein GIS00_24975 [Nakamurella sp. YIM 132087]|uniref:Muconate cycloisomerase n=1 Tax=Nakamurella alba TaxID=2665158 RepID=A0A7K1FSR2_9ACTN|nr:enolase C-terminal domain-like protein [Nakamurella alba]MTD17192.1 hypothetical protein [Nakamurella alba]
MPVISDVRLTSVNTPRTNGAVCGHVIVELLTDHDPDAPVGLGEMSDLQHLPRYHPDVADLQGTLRELLVGRDSLDLTALTALMEQNFPQGGYVYDKSRAIRCGVDLALWDLNARSLGLRVCDLLGGAVRDALPIAYPVFRALTPADVEANLAQVDTVMATGQRTFRVYAGRDLALDEQFLRAVRDRHGDSIVLKSLDFSNLLGWKQACAFVERVADLGIDLVESPARTDDLAGLTLAAQRLPVPVSEHVHSYRQALQLADSGVDVFNVSIIAIGGITPIRTVIAIAEAAGKECLLGTTQELSIGTAAAAHVGVAMRAITLPSDPVGPLLYTTDVVRQPVSFAGGRLWVPDGPGLGMELDPERLAAAAGPLSWSGTTATAVVDRRAGSTG